MTLKILLAVFVAILSVKAFAQVSAGIGSPGGTVRELTPAQKAAFDYQLKIKLAGNEVLRVVNGTNYNVIHSVLWLPVSGEVKYSAEDDVLILYYSVLEAGYGRVKMALKNYRGEATVGKNINALAIRVGTYNWSGTPLELWDCGKPYVPPK